METKKMQNFKLLLIVAAISLSACTRPQNAQETLTKNGYTDVQINGYGWFSCDEKDTFADAFTAKSPSGHVVTGTVCSGVFKGSTIRFD